ncbi:hypothetical protein CKF54_05780 [Psittacicella hinzii]|uniref:YobI-like P-loop NTPase domain-containing protein n=1 Tax=Psittacicella hinzii TaxID=2028575 RepID=A0A3A1Y3S4_9GAMM|nr:hypothetical protein [Psittacicella hinzii]RIY31949.1 hypothetical protein CKF54_05780 [Psittacicella hinzii]
MKTDRPNNESVADETSAKDEINKQAEDHKDNSAQDKVTEEKSTTAQNEGVEKEADVQDGAVEKEVTTQEVPEVKGASTQEGTEEKGASTQEHSEEKEAKDQEGTEEKGAKTQEGTAEKDTAAKEGAEEKDASAQETKKDGTTQDNPEGSKQKSDTEDQKAATTGSDAEMAPEKEVTRVKYHSLAPIDSIEPEKMEPYSHMLDEAFRDPTIKNIAVTGPYGSGKSSIWLSYLKNKSAGTKQSAKKNEVDKNELGKVITISFALFDEDNRHYGNEGNGGNGSESYLRTINRVERQIIIK